MNETDLMMEPDIRLEILGQLPFLQIYTQICFCYSVADPSLYPVIIETLEKGLERVSASFPWIAGKIVNEGSGRGNSGVFKIKPYKKILPFIVKDLRHDASVPFMEALRRAQFPFRMLDESVVAPYKTLPARYHSDPRPIFVLQASLISGGLLLTFLAQHNTMDMTAQAQIIHLISKACRDELFTSEELSSGNLERHDLIRLLDESYEPGPELAQQIIKPISVQSKSKDVKPPTCSWTYFTFNQDSLSALKSLAMQTISPSSGYASTDDALSAFIWQAVIRARIHRLSPTTEATFARAVNVRRYLDVPETYPGLIQNMAYSTREVQELVKEPLGAIASLLRLAVDPKTSKLGYNTRALATFLSRTPDKNVVSYSATLDLSVDIMLSSWAKLDFYDTDFNLGLGKPEAVRRPQFTPVESLVYLMPRTLDGEIAVAICLRDEDLERLKADDDFMKHGKHIA
ncbi:MAG: hypothetical protein M1825_003017 [Sarcosagium campestre]|nr:MAG: hypothetical protein M1825_003017 [Sarcosagium campestre]